MNNMIARQNICLVRKVVEEAQSSTGIYLPDNSNGYLAKFVIITVGDKVEDLQPGDVVLADDLMQPIGKLEKNVGLLNQNQIHLIYGKQP